MTILRVTRREVVAALGSAAAWPLMTYAQTGKVPRIGVLWHAGNEHEEAPFLGALRKGLNDLGYTEGKNIESVNRFADEHYDRFDPLARELVEAKVDVIVASVPSAALAAKRATNAIPVVLSYGGDFQAQGEDGTFSREHFRFDEERNVYVCPAGKTLTTTSHVGPDHGIRYFASVRDCRACVLNQNAARTCWRAASCAM